MKKSLVLSGILCATAFVGVVLIGTSLYRDTRTVQLKENVLYGDPGEAGGLTFTLSADLFDRVFWKTEHTLGAGKQGKTECTADFSGDEPAESGNEALAGQEDYFQICWGYDGIDGSDDSLYEKLIQENNISSWYSKTFRLKDEYDYYPMRIELSLGHLREDPEHEATADQKKVIRRVEEELASYFHIPVYDETMRVLITTDDEGKLMHGDLSTADTLQETISSQCIVADHAVWFAFSRGYDVSGQAAGKYLNGLPGGAGVYRLPYQVKEGIPHFETDRLEQVHSISADTVLSDYIVDPDARRILIHTEREGKHEITVLSSETGEYVDKILLKSLPGDEMVSLRYKEGAVMISSEGRRIVLEEAQGSYRISMDVETAEESYYCRDFAWNGDKLAVFAGEGQGGYYVFVYGREGLLYRGRYVESMVMGEGRKDPEISFISYDDANVNLRWK